MAPVEKTIDLGFVPRSIFEDFHNRTERWACMICHRRAGKTVASIMSLLTRALNFKLPAGRFHYIAPLRNQAKTVAWDYLTEFSRPVQAGKPNIAELRVDLINGSRITLFGADNPDALRGPYSDGAVLDEYADIVPSVWEQIVRPMLADREGFAIILGTIKGRNQLWELYKRNIASPEWFTMLLKASETNIIPPIELEDARRLMTPEAYAAEFECDPYAAILGAYYAKEIQEAETGGRFVDSLPILDAPMHTAWDLGNGSNMAIWVFQVGEKGPLIHDFIQKRGFYFDDYIKHLNELGYDGFDYLPHDARVHSFETGRTRVETLIAAGRKPVMVPKHSVDDGVNAAKMTMRVAKFNASACDVGIESLRQYRQEWNEKLRVFRSTAEHDWASHGADAFRYLAMAWKMIRKEIDPLPRPLFIQTPSLTIADYVAYGNPSRRKEERA